MEAGAASTAATSLTTIGMSTAAPVQVTSPLLGSDQIDTMAQSIEQRLPSAPHVIPVPPPDHCPMDVTVQTPRLPSEPGTSSASKRPPDPPPSQDGKNIAVSPGGKRPRTNPRPPESMSSHASYKVIIKPKCNFDMSKLPNRIIQRTLDAYLHVSEFKGFALHRPTNTISVWVHSMEDVSLLQSLQTIEVSKDLTVPVQAYLSSGTDLRRYVVSGVDAGEDPATLLQDLKCPTHRVVAARYLGKGRSCLVTLSGPSDPPPRMYYYGCVLHVRQYRPSAVYCYKCLRPGHMKASCPYTAAEVAETTTSQFTCGLCKTNDHQITSPLCPTKRKATEQMRQRQTLQLVTSRQQQNVPTIEVSNRYAALSTDLTEEQLYEIDEPEPQWKPTYSEITRCKSRPSRTCIDATLNDETETLDALDQRLATLESEIQRIRRRRAILSQRHIQQRSPTPPAPPSSFTTSPATPPSSPVHMRETPMTPQQLLLFVSKQLQHLASVLAAHLSR